MCKEEAVEAFKRGIRLAREHDSWSKQSEAIEIAVTEGLKNGMDYMEMLAALRAIKSNRVHKWAP
jgi:anti-sigma regulatory factor (Ser/Thr protein kinase)